MPLVAWFAEQRRRVSRRGQNGAKAARASARGPARARRGCDATHLPEADGVVVAGRRQHDAGGRGRHGSGASTELLGCASASLQLHDVRRHGRRRPRARLGFCAGKAAHLLRRREQSVRVDMISAVARNGMWPARRRSGRRPHRTLSSCSRIAGTVKPAARAWNASSEGDRSTLADAARSASASCACATCGALMQRPGRAASFRTRTYGFESYGGRKRVPTSVLPGRGPGLFLSVFLRQSYACALYCTRPHAPYRFSRRPMPPCSALLTPPASPAAAAATHGSCPGPPRSRRRRRRPAGPPCRAP